MLQEQYLQLHLLQLNLNKNQIFIYLFFIYFFLQRKKKSNTTQRNIYYILLLKEVQFINYLITLYSRTNLCILYFLTKFSSYRPSHTFKKIRLYIYLIFFIIKKKKKKSYLCPTIIIFALGNLLKTNSKTS
jgi:hypothetical protein